MKKRFIFDEKYIKKYAKKNKIKLLIVVACVLILIAVVIVVMMMTRANENKKPASKKRAYEVKKELVVESGSYLPEAVDYFSLLENVDAKDIELEYPNEFEISYDTSLCNSEELDKITNGEAKEEDLECAKQNVISPATYGISVKIDKKEYTTNLKIVDTTAPVILTNNVEILVGEDYKIDDFINICYDVSRECKLSFAKEEYGSYKDAGEYEVGIIATDQYNNESKEVKATLTIKQSDKKIYTVSFNSDGGTKIEAKKVEEGNTITEPKTEKEGYTFLGWYNGKVKFDFKTAITSDITLVAKWQKNSGGNTSTNPGTINVSSISLSHKKIFLDINASKTVTATVRPSNATNKNVVWTSKDNSIATVANGKITGKKLGTTIITATAGGKSASVEVVVQKGGGQTCKYGDASYNKTIILSVNLVTNNCAVNPSISHDDATSSAALADYQKLVKSIDALGYRVVEGSYTTNYTPVRNNSGLGLVGYQITVNIQVTNGSGAKRIRYKLKLDGSRVYEINEINLK